MMEIGKRLPGLDGLRAIFCVGIVLFHVNGAFGSVFSGWLGPVYAYGGYFGNYLFFLVSGLLAALHYKERFLEGDFRIRSFLKKRFLRLYPLYFLSNLCAVLVPGTARTLPKTIATFLLLPPAGASTSPYNLPSWFLSVLMVCCVLYGLTGTLSRFRPRLYLPLCGCFALCGMLFMRLSLSIPFLSQSCGEGYLNFFLGAFLAEAFLRPSPDARLLTAVSCAVFGASVLGICLFGFEGMPVDARWVMTLICLSLVCLALCAAPLVRFLGFTPFRALGSCSFSVFLWHVPLARWYLFLERRLGLVITDQRPNLLLYLALLLELSALSRRFLEKPAERYASLLRPLFAAGVLSVFALLIANGVGDTFTVSLLGLCLCAVGLFRRSAQVDLGTLVPFLLYCLVGMLSAFNIYRSTAAGYYVSMQLVFPVICLFMATLEPERLRFLKRFCLLVAGAMAAVSVGQFVFLAVLWGKAGRLGGVLTNPNAMGIFCVSAWFALAHCLAEREEFESHLASFLPHLEPILLCALAMTLSMGSFAAMSAGIFLVFLKKRKETSGQEAFSLLCRTLARASLGIGTGLLLYLAAARTNVPASCLAPFLYALVLTACWKKFLLFLEARPKAAVLIALGGFFVAAAVVLSRPSSLDTFTERLEMMRNGLGYLFRYPILGVGPGQWRFHNLYGDEKYFNTWYIHNALIHVGAELGMTALALLLLCAIRVFQKQTEPWAKAGIAAFFVHNLLDTAFFHTGIMALLVTTLSEPRARDRKLGNRTVKLLFGGFALIFLYNMYYCMGT